MRLSPGKSGLDSLFMEVRVFKASETLRLLNALNSEDRGLKVRFSLATIAFDKESAQISQILSSQGKNAPSNPYPHYLVRLAASRKWDFAVRFALDMSLLTALSKSVPQGKRRLDRESAV